MRRWARFHPTGRLIAFGQAGHDAILADGSINAAAWFFGGAGNDLLKGGRGPNVLLGGAGQDALTGGSGRDILIGGFGFDLLIGGAGDDLMIGGTTAFDDDEESLDAIQEEWTSSRDAATRRANLSGTGIGERFNGEVFLTTSTVFDDGDEDLLIGSSGDDWLFLGDDDLGL